MTKMKNILLGSLILLLCSSCQEFDNYEEPQETLKGSIVDKETQLPFYTEAGDNGVRIKLMEYSWSDTPTPYYFTVMQDGTFNNTKIFKGEYGIEPLGAFVPLGEIYKEIKGSVDLRFEVEPFLRIEYMGDPIVDKGKITIHAKITRGTSNPNYQQSLSDVYLFINGSSPYVGNNNFDDRYDMHLSGEAVNKILGKTITLTTEGELPTGRTYYLRVGARIDRDIDGVKRYNYADVITVDL